MEITDAGVRVDPHGQAGAPPESDRVAPGHPRHADPPDSSVGTAAWLWHRSDDPLRLGGRSASRNRIFIPGAASARKARLDQIRMAQFGAQSARKILSTHGGGQKAARP